MKNKFVITVVGRDTVGIIAKVCTYLADHQVNILDISQTIVDGYFNMMMIVDAANAGDVTEMSGDLAAPQMPPSGSPHMPYSPLMPAPML